MADLFERCRTFISEQQIARGADLDVARRVLFDVLPVENAGPFMDGDGRELLQFSSNDYLGLSTHPEVRRAAAETAARHGIGAPMGARPLTGTCRLHLELEEKIAEFKGTEAALAFTIGAGAMLGAVACLARPGDLVVLDQFAHASLACGARISGAEIRTFRHNDPASLLRILSRAPRSQAKLVVVDGVYSMNGDVAPLPEICDLCDIYGARLVVDDAHGNGVLGRHGRGTAEDQGVEDRIDLHLGTFSKAFGTCGGFVAGAAEVVFYVRCLAPTLLFTKAPSAAATAATLVSLDLVRAGTDLRERLHANASLLQATLRERGFDIGATCTPITPIRFDAGTALRIADRLRTEHGIFVSPVVYPAVSRGAGLLRVVPTARHRPEDVHRLVDALVACRTALGVDRAPPPPLGIPEGGADGAASRRATPVAALR